MSKAAKQSIFILIIILVAVIGFAGFTVIQKQKLEQANVQLKGELQKTKQQAQASANQAAQLKGSLDKAQKEAAQLKQAVTAAQEQSKSLMAEVDAKSKEAQKLKSRADDLSKTRDQLMGKVRELTENLNKAEQEKEEMMAAMENPAPQDGKEESRDKRIERRMASDTTEMIEDPDIAEDSYWAGVLKAKVSLELEVEALNDELAQSALEVLELKQENADLQVELDGLIADKDEIENEISFKEEMVNNLSLELARSKNDKKYVSDRLDKIVVENNELRKQIKNLITSKSALEKSIVRISQDKSKIEKELGNTESIIQSKIDEIWEIKESLDETIKNSEFKPPKSDIELPPIVVSSDQQASVPFNSGMSNPGFSGAVVSVNNSNNFVITDIGQKTGVRLGDQLSVYRDSKYIARLEVIQVRDDISAADIKDQWTKIQVGDIVR